MHDACFLVPEDWSWSPSDSLAYMDRAGVQMQMLSYLPMDIDSLKASNEHAASWVRQHPTRFGLLCALPTEDAQACLKEISRGLNDLNADGFAVTAIRKGVYLSDLSLEPVWTKLNELGATVFSHPNAYASPTDGRPAPLIDVAFETCRVAVDMLYRGVFKRYPNINFIFSHCGGALPALFGRLELLGAESWVPNPEKLTREEIREQLGRLHVDTAATAATGMGPAVQMVGMQRVCYGSDCGVPCSTEATMERNREAVMSIEESLDMVPGTVGENAWKLFPTAARRVTEGRLVNGVAD